MIPEQVEIRPIGFVRRISQHENDRDRSLVAKVVLDNALAPALDGIEDWSHIYVIFGKVSEHDPFQEGPVRRSLD